MWGVVVVGSNDSNDMVAMTAMTVAMTHDTRMGL